MRPTAFLAHHRRLLILGLIAAFILAALWAALHKGPLSRFVGWQSTDELFDATKMVAQERADLHAAQKQSASALARSVQLEKQAAKARDEAEKLKLQSISLAARIQSAEADIQGAEAKLAAVNRQRESQQRKLARQQKPLMELTALLQQLSRRPPTTLLAQPGSLDELVHARIMIETVMPVVEEKSALVRQELVALRGLLAQQKHVIQSLEAAHHKLAEQRAALSKLEQDGRARSLQLAHSARLENDRAIGLGEKARDITTLIAALEVDSQTRSELMQLPGPLARPSRPDDPITATPPPAQSVTDAMSQGAYHMPVMGRIVTGFSELDDSGIRSRGLRIATAAGAQVVAPAAGRVSYAGDYRGYGKILIMDHGGGWTSLMAGMIALSAAVGDELDGGIAIGRAGAAGQDIIVELRRNGTPIDILALIR